MSHCRLNSQDIQSLARVNVEGKLPQLRHLDISDYEQKFEISDLFAHSSQWNQLTTPETNDYNVLNVACVLLASLEELRLKFLTEDPPVTRCWPGLKVIRLDFKDGLSCIADGVERGMFPSVVTVKILGLYDDEERIIPSLFKLYKANISVIE